MLGISKKGVRSTGLLSSIASGFAAVALLNALSGSALAESYNQPLFTAIENGDVLKAEELLKKGSNPNEQNKCNGHVPLHAASFYGYTSILRSLIDSKANLDTQDRNGNTALYFSVLGERPDITQTLIEAGANLNIQNNIGKSTALHLATSKNLLDITRQLVKAGANVNIQDNVGETALHQTVRKGNLEMVKLLVEAGANPNIKSVLCMSALDIAETTRNEEMKDILREAARKAPLQTSSSACAKVRTPAAP